MAKNRGSSENAPKPSAKAPAAGPAGWVKGIVSLLVAWHVFVVFISPLATPPTSELVYGIARSPLIRWYSDPLYLNHGYHFFGPEPPINHLVRYRVIDNSGALVAEGEFPNNEQQTPRLLYHRHMMLADQAGLGPGDIDPAEWTRLTLRGYARHLLRRHGGDEAVVDYLQHFPLYPDESRRGDDPNHPELFDTLETVRVTTSELQTPLPVPAPPRENLEPGVEAIPPGVAQ